MGKVNHQKIEEYYSYFINNELDSLCLIHQTYPNVNPTNHPELVLVIPPAPHLMFSYQIAFWKKSMLREMALPHENPWMSEWYGSQRAEKMHIKLACPNKDSEDIINYNAAGCLHQGKWMDNAVNFLKSINYLVDFDKRGYYVDGYSTFIFRVRLKLKIWSTGLKGSYLDLFLRKKNV